MYKIILNFMPRSASSFFFDTLRESYGHNQKDFHKPRYAGEWSHKDTWIVLAHDPLLFHGVFDDTISMITTLRDPIDAVTSQILKTSYGYGNATIAGRPEIVDGNMEFFKTQKEEYIRESMYQESMMWLGYCFGLRKAIDRIIPFTFEQTTSMVEEILPHIHRLVGVSDDVRVLTNEEVRDRVRHMTNHYKDDVNFSSGAANGLPTEKPAEYQIIKNLVLQSEWAEKMMNEYRECLALIKQRQLTLGIDLDLGS